ncbi:PREDICTED: putative late blight resistance protein homolog R1A-10 [Nicotiana attenuata]|uniref:Late blight resistance protein -like r1b-14 n=1 Tax=Nicotiana attenuata TaxID=49451 RepID=A0A1J6K3Y1_NICAT|nr:PREDICTED: putative late blight resistance protein homolog R1A-10 [Nicotiana attenuata]OIT23356.1 putative late blight resistance protein -like r1b-14 [Nicotiana attenuata]
MADAVVNFLLENLLQLVTNNVKLISGVEKDFQNLLEEVRRLKAFLDDAAKYHSDSSLWKQLVRDIRITVHRAEDVIDKFLVQAKLHQEKNKVKRSFDLCHVRKVWDLAKDIKTIHQNVKEFRQNNQKAFQPKPMLDLPQKVAREPQDTLLEYKEVVGFDYEAEYVIKRLVEGSKDLEVVPIVGMPGIGKTTLARKVWSHSQISNNFSKKIWVYVGRSYELKGILSKILISFMERIEEFRYKDVNGLAEVICDFMAKEGGRCLIVLDDVWAKELVVVDLVKRVLEQNNKGHRIVMTTRDEYVASYASEHPHRLKYLSDEESFQLLEKRAFGSERCPDELVELGKSIATKCSGLPLAVQLSAGALRSRPNKNYWERIEKNVGLYLVIENDPASCWEIVETSYNILPQEMKACFLYCFAFLQGYSIPAQKLIRLWIAEGLIKSSPTCTFEELAENYLEEFALRGLVTLSRDGDSIKEIGFHDVLYEFYKTEAIMESVFQELRLTPDQILPSIQDPDTSRRLCIESSVLRDFLSRKQLNAEHVRSFLCFSTTERQIELSLHDVRIISQAFPLIRVLEIQSVKIFLPMYLNQLFHLRYIAISGDFAELPASFGKFWNLQFLIVNTSTPEPTLKIKANIWNLSRLRHLKTNIPAELLPPPNPTVEGSCLQILSKVAPKSCNKVVLAKAGNLKKLSIQGRLGAFLETNKDGFSTFQGLGRLEKLKLMNDVPYMSEALHLPPELFRFLRKLKKLTLSNTRFKWNEADRLGQLECLEVLRLKEDAFTGKSWKPEKGGFKQLQVLWIQKADLECWEASRDHFPRLKKLVLNCAKLENVPVEFSHLGRSRS